MRSVVYACLLLAAASTPAYAQQSQPSSNPRPRFWVDIGAGGHWSSQEALAQQQDSVLFGEPAVKHAGYPWVGSGGNLHFGGGYQLRPRLGVGAKFSGRTAQLTADLTVLIPSPIFTNAYGSDVMPTEALRRGENWLDLFAAFDVLQRGRWQWRAFGGPSVFWVSHQLVTSVDYIQTFGVSTPTNVVDIVGYSAPIESATAWGFNVGTDLTWYATPRIGITGHVHANQGRLDVNDPLSGGTVRLTTGGIVAGAGARIRF